MATPTASFMAELARSSGARMEQVLIRGTALTAPSRPTSAGPRPTWTIRYVAEYRCGPE